MPGLRDQYRVDAVVGQRDLLGGAEQRRGLRQGRGEHLEHLSDRVDGHDVQAAFDEARGQLAGSGAQIEHIARSCGRSQSIASGGYDGRPRS